MSDRAKAYVVAFEISACIWFVIGYAVWTMAR